MPANEEIYKPFGFEFIYEQKREKIIGKQSDDTMLKITRARNDDCQKIADFANEILLEYDVVTWRDEKYYQTLISELKSEEGGILIAEKDSQILGVFPYAKGHELQIHEPLMKERTFLQHAIYHLAGNETALVLCTGYGSEESKPIIMAKVLNPEFNFDLENAKVFLNEVV